MTAFAVADLRAHGRPAQSTRHALHGLNSLRAQQSMWARSICLPLFVLLSLSLSLFLSPSFSAGLPGAFAPEYDLGQCGSAFLFLSLSLSLSSLFLLFLFPLPLCLSLPLFPLFWFLSLSLSLSLPFPQAHTAGMISQVPKFPPVRPSSTFGALKLSYKVKCYNFRAVTHAGTLRSTPT